MMPWIGARCSATMQLVANYLFVGGAVVDSAVDAQDIVIVDVVVVEPQRLRS